MQNELLDQVRDLEVTRLTRQKLARLVNGNVITEIACQAPTCVIGNRSEFYEGRGSPCVVRWDATKSENDLTNLALMHKSCHRKYVLSQRPPKTKEEADWRPALAFVRDKSPKDLWWQEDDRIAVRCREVVRFCKENGFKTPGGERNLVAWLREELGAWQHRRPVGVVWVFKTPVAAAGGGESSGE